METKMQVQTCGKLYLAGEYAVLSPGHAALIKNISIYMRAEIEAADSYELDSDLFSHKASLAPDADYALIQETIQLMNDYLSLLQHPSRPFALTIRGKMEKDGRKFGLGSSGSVVVLTIKAMAAFYQLELSSDLLFRLASAVLLKRGDNGSMGDLACIAYEQLVYYRSFDRMTIRQRLVETNLLEILEQDWGYEIKPIQPSLGCDFLVGWTREPAISSDLVKQVKSSLNEDFLTQTQLQVDGLKEAFLSADKTAVKNSLLTVSQLLDRLSPLIYTEKLQDLREASQGLDCVAKSSGAGGGDCGFALSFATEDSQTLIQRWQEAGLELLYQERIGAHEPKS
ncbi:phosphomevalonate kinase [Streptococcus cristatus]|uniref:phosphomevalonate kinase n=1 Tax=Streptococcus cristatus TaxID=45634 RepID=UPI0007837EFB|nr:phosphomevalonate kinase [Streptococcus cristatus]